MAVILPPKIYHYEPKIFGFKIAGKRGSKYYNPPKGNVKYMEDSVQALDLQEAIKKGSHVESLIPKFEDKLHISGGDSGANTAASLHKETELLEDSKGNAAAGADTNKGGKKNRKKNKKWASLLRDGETQSLSVDYALWQKFDVYEQLI